ncbi:hypothetical protein ACFS2C_27395 [Prauserella oleivorans]|uniref:Uncharacterized protein n=1 Tax=Prauserella oleivorans TaxID=1478153 RepID=A0ABW5WL78_9PSEU
MTSLNPLKLARAELARRFGRFVDFRIDEHLRTWHGHVRTLDRHGERIAALERRLDAVTRELEQVRGDLRWTANEVERLVPHVAAQESRLEDLRGRLALTPAATEPEVARARSLIEEVQRQHSQIRVRLSGIARYEERLRRLEERVAASARE